MTAQEWLALLGAGGFGAVVTALINKYRPKEDRDAVQAGAEKARLEGQAVVITSMAEAFTETTGGLRGEVERLRTEAGEIRAQAASLETRLEAALAKVDDLERQLDEAKADLERVRGERDAATARADTLHDRCVQQEGEIRQLQAVVEAHARVKEA